MTNPRIKALQNKIDQIASWTPRLKKLAKIKSKQGIPDYSDSQFCRDHDLPQSKFSRWKNSWKNEDEYMPKQESIDKVNAALTAEGV